MCARIVGTHDDLVEDFGCAWQVIKTCLDDTAVRACAEHLGLVHPHALVAEQAVQRDFDIEKVRHGAIVVLKREEGETRTLY